MRCAQFWGQERIHLAYEKPATVSTTIRPPFWFGAATRSRLAPGCTSKTLESLAVLALDTSPPKKHCAEKNCGKVIYPQRSIQKKSLHQGVEKLRSWYVSELELLAVKRHSCVELLWIQHAFPWEVCERLSFNMIIISHHPATKHVIVLWGI